MEQLDDVFITFLRELYLGQSLVPSCRIDELEDKEYDLSAILQNTDLLKELISDVDNVFLIDDVTDYDKQLIGISAVRSSGDKFKLKLTLI
jgi:hypothetical protein